MRQLYVVDLGTVGYSEAMGIQERVVDARFKDKVPDVLLLLEHHPVYTAGTLARDVPEERLFTGERLQGIEVIRVDRGGHITYHAPGQLVGYPIRRLESQRGVADHVKWLEDTMLRVAGDFGAELKKKEVEYDPRTRKREKFKGVWYPVDGKDYKVGAIGMQMVSRNGDMVTKHGFALNVDIHLEPFNHIDPCGLPQIGVTSLKKILGKYVPMGEVKDKTVEHFADIFGYEGVEHISPESLERMIL